MTEPGREPGVALDAEIAEKVMGWKKLDRRAMGWGEGPLVWATGDDREEGSPTRQHFEPSTDTASAISALEHHGQNWEIGRNVDAGQYQYRVCVWFPGGDQWKVEMAPTLAHAACLALLAAFDHTEEG